MNPSYLQRIDRANIVGYGRPWRDAESVAATPRIHAFCVLKGDIYGYGGMMHANAQVPVRQALEDAVRQWARRAVVAQTTAGDSVLIVHEDPVALAQTARHIVDEVYRATGQPLLRMALHYGDVQLQAGVDDEPPTIVGGTAILTAARVEPHVSPGQIWATEEFREVLMQRPSLWRTNHVPAPDGGELFNVKKDGRSEPDLWVKLYRLQF